MNFVSKIVLRSECEFVCGCLSRLSLCSPVMDWRPVQGVEVGKMIDSKMHRDSAVYDSASLQQRDIIVIILFFLGAQ